MHIQAPRALDSACLRAKSAIGLTLLALLAGWPARAQTDGDAVSAGAADGEATVVSPADARTAPDQSAQAHSSADKRPLMPLDISLSWSANPTLEARLGLRGEPGELVAYLLEHLQSGEAELGLSEAVDMALRQNHALNQKRLEALAACRGRAVIWADLGPQLSLDAKAFGQIGNGRDSIVIPGGETVDFGTGGELVRSLALGLTKRIYDFGRTQGLLNANSAQQGIRHFSVRIAEQQLVAAVADSYLRFSLAVGFLRLRQDELALAQDFCRQAQLQFDAGIVPRLDVIRAQARVEQAREALIGAEAALGDAAAYFYSLLGAEDQRYVPSVITADLLKVDAAVPDLEASTRLAADRRPEIELQYNLLFAGEAKLDLARTRPTLQGYLNALWQEPASSALAGTDNYEYGVELLWKLYSGGKDKAEREVSRTDLKAIAEGILDLEAQVELDATTAYNRLTRARAGVGSAQRSLDFSAEALRAAAVGYSAGVTPYIEFESALDQNVAAALGYFTALIEVKRAQINLARAQGFPAGYAALPELLPAAPDPAAPAAP